MKGTRWWNLFDEFSRRAHRELRVTLHRPAAPEKWLFLVGCYNSGTTLIAEVLGEHPKIAALPDEGQYLTDQLLVDYKIGVPRMWVQREDLFRMQEDSHGPDVHRIRKEWASRLPRRAPVVLEKTPANMARTRWLQANFPNSYFVGIVRNPYAVIDGIRRKADPQHLPGGWPLEMCARQWARSNEVLADDAAHLDHFMWLRYEDFVSSPHDSLQRVMEFVGLPVEASIVRNQTWAIHERNEPIRDLNAESIARLGADDLAVIDRLIGDQIDRFGYQRLGSGLPAD